MQPRTTLLRRVKISNRKKQISNKFQNANHNARQRLIIENWHLELICYLLFVFCHFHRAKHGGAGRSLSRSYGCFIAEFLDASFPVHLGLLDHPTGVGLRYGFSGFSDATVFLEAERDRLARVNPSNRYRRSTQPGDLPPDLNALRLPRAVNAHALIFPLGHAAPRLKLSFSTNISSPF